MTADKPRRLGRGLEALLSSVPSSATSAPPGTEQNILQRIPVRDIKPNPYQPRKEFGAAELADLEASLRTSGLLQPITVRPASDGRGYELIAGERRLRAAARLDWKEIPALVRPIDDRTLLTLALVENLQRTDLNPLEEAEGYQRLMDDFELTQQEVADVVGKDRSTVANMVRLLQLPASVRRMLQDGQLTVGHARALLALGNERAITELAREVVAKGLTVREVERRTRELGGPKTSSRATPYADAKVPEARRIEEQLRRRLQTDVEITLSGKDKGAIRISFYSADDLERVLDLVLGATREPL